MYAKGFTNQNKTDVCMKPLLIYNGRWLSTLLALTVVWKKKQKTLRTESKLLKNGFHFLCHWRNKYASGIKPDDRQNLRPDVQFTLWSDHNTVESLFIRRCFTWNNFCFCGTLFSTWRRAEVTRVRRATCWRACSPQQEGKIVILAHTEWNRRHHKRAKTRSD